MEATALSVGKSVLNGALDYTKSALAEEVALQLGVQRDQAFIRDELEMMRSFLMAAQDEQDGNKVVKTWVKQVRDVAYDVEDCLQDFAIRLGKKKPYWWLSPRTLQERRCIAKEMKELRGKVEDVSQRNMRYQLIKDFVSGSTCTGDALRGSTARATMSGMYEARWQQEKAKTDLVRLVNYNAEDYKVIAVWGSSSSDSRDISIIGRAYDHLKRRNKFECCAWVDLMHPLQPTELLQSIARQFYIRSLQEASEAKVLRRIALMNEDCLADEFVAFLRDKCYLIVLNDISTIQEWEQIKTYFPENKKGSRLIVSTQQVEVASLCAGTDNMEPEHMQLFANQTLYAFHCESAKDGTNSLEERSSSLNVGTSCANNSTDGHNLTRTETMVAAFKESELIGRVDEKAKIIELISKGSQHLEKISVWGMGGIGKTVLVQEVYRSEKVKGIFDKVACVTIKRPFNLRELIRSLVKQLEDPKTSGRKETEKASEKKEPSLTEILEGKKYLIVLDDVSSMSEWDAIESHFPATEIGSRIIVTTRSESVAKRCSGDDEEKRYKLTNLGNKDAKDLFMKKVFKNTQNLDGLDPELVEEAKLILRKCSGLPLAIVTIGGVLASQPKTALEWRKLNDHISAELEMNPGLETIRTVLDVSYDGLPYHLKSCFLYLSIFPGNHKISRGRLVRRWTAEGYSREVFEKSAEEIADSYFFELRDRSMIVPAQYSIKSSRGTESCQVHDLMRDIAIKKSKEENLVLRLDGGCMLHSRTTVRHLAITNSSWEGDEDELETTVDMSRIRSLTVFGEWRPFFISDKMRMLRVLDLEDTQGVGDHQIKQIGKLIHLKYLSLIGCDITCLPDSLGNLRQLETLDLRRTKIVKLPKTIINLQKLNYLRSGDRKGHIYKKIAEKLPELMRNSICICTARFVMRCLRCSAAAFSAWEAESDTCKEQSAHHIIDMRLDRHGVLAPRGLRRLTALRTLDVLNITKERTALEDISSLTQLRKFGVIGVNKINRQKFFSSLGALTRLESLSVHSEGEPGLSGCEGRDGKFSPPKGLKSLKLHGNLVELPKWIQQLNNLVKLTLSSTRLNNHLAATQVLGELPNLAILRLWNKSFEGGELHFPERSFGSLMVLEIISLGDIKYIKFEQGAADKLELMLLIVEGGLKFSGLKFLQGIKEVQLNDFSKTLEEKERFKMDLVTQLSENSNKPILKVM
uniref:Uncharacterized protein n=1 Tax=Leersia perrieri TaxID=77586 RepID=A0A0D9Y0B3_9ORYZ